jgi:peptidyl-prolyl cis-trans isomerase C
VTKKLIILTTILLLGAVFTNGVFAADDTAEPDVASVNGSIISADAVKREMNMMYQRAVQQGVYPDSSEIDVYWQQAVDTLIGREILYQDAIANGYTLDEEQIDSYVASLVQNYGSEEDLNAMLVEQGLDIVKLREDTGIYFVISDYVTNVLSAGITVSDEDARKYYDDNSAMFKQEETVTARHILLTVEEGSEQTVINDAKNRITAIRERIIVGEDFAELAQELSDCPSKDQGGNLGEFGRGQMVPPFEQAAFSLEPGVVSEPVFTKFGWHLIEVTSKNSGGMIAFEELAPQIIEYLGNVILEEKVNLRVEVVKEKSEIIIFQ